jgi:hypothetical protein
MYGRNTETTEKYSFLPEEKLCFSVVPDIFLPGCHRQAHQRCRDLRHTTMSAKFGLYKLALIKWSIIMKQYAASVGGQNTF